MCNLTDPIYHDKDAARKHLEALRWPDGPICPHCGEVDNAHEMTGKSTRPGLYKCRGCRKPFTVTVGTVFERSRVPLNKWVLATHLMASSKKGFSAEQLRRTIGVTYKTAWFMFHRLREAMRDDSPANFGPGGGVVEVDETYIGNDRSIKAKHEKKGRGFNHKYKVLSLVDRNSGRAKSIVVDKVNSKTLIPLVNENTAKEAVIYTDEAAAYKSMRKHHKHEFVSHGAGEYVRGQITTNTIEGYFSIFKRGMKGIYQHCGKNHLHRYLAEFDFRYNNRQALGIQDAERAANLLKGIGGKRLIYRRPVQQS